MPGRKKLTAEEVRALLPTAPGWGYIDGRLRSQFQTLNFANGVTLVNQVASIADELNHHPDILLTYPRVVIDIYTHDIEGVTEMDFELARRITGLLA
ncbi:MAG: 4a-hydroxytetrahydrobiopterin dehydratase [candidate division Zixibacteria bacterium]|nr:4a-hydroxytetrahydrobiopterin dehydratase [candidate division Zixibacteria bacterium]